MKLEAEIKWILDNKVLGIEANRIDTVLVDADYVEGDEDLIVEWIENELTEKYNVLLVHNKNFVIVNLDDLIDDLASDEDEDETEYDEDEAEYDNM